MRKMTVKIEIYNNKLCPICGQAYYLNGAAVVCRRHRGSVCMEHCVSCQYHTGPECHCRYRPDEDRERAINELYEKHGVERKCAIPKGMTQKEN